MVIQTSARRCPEVTTPDSHVVLIVVQVTYECLMKSIAKCKPGMPYREIGDIVTAHAQAQRFSVVKTYCGHGIGELFHCKPNIPHYSNNKTKGLMQVRQPPPPSEVFFSRNIAEATPKIIHFYYLKKII